MADMSDTGDHLGLTSAGETCTGGLSITEMTGVWADQQSRQNQQVNWEELRV